MPTAMVDADGSLTLLTQRVRHEFEEMPGTCLSLPQASRLFGVAPAVGERVLRQLVEAGVLQRMRDGRYRLRVSAP